MRTGRPSPSDVTCTVTHLFTIVSVTIHIAHLYFSVTFALLCFTIAPAAVQFTFVSLASLVAFRTVTF